jgi:hypothetical protein
MSAEEDLLYFPDPGQERVRQTMGWFLLIGGGGLGSLFLIIAVLAGPLYSANVAQDPLAEAVPAVVFPILALLFGLGSAGLGLWLLRRPPRGWLQLTHDELMLVTGRQSTVLYLKDVEYLSAYFDRSAADHQPAGPWIVRIEDRSGQAIELDVGEAESPTTYDVRLILGDLLPRLPEKTKIDSRIVRYIETGQMAGEANGRE